MRRHRAALSEARRASEGVRIRADERRTLSRELHDVVAHHLSTASLQIMGVHGSQDPESLAQTLTAVDNSTSEALIELRLLVQVLRDHPATSASGSELRELAEILPPTRAAANAELNLIDAGFEPHLSLPAAVDRLTMTVTRTINQATNNAIRHAPARCRVELQAQVFEHELLLRVTNPVPLTPRLPAWAGASDGCVNVLPSMAARSRRACSPTPGW